MDKLIAIALATIILLFTTLANASEKCLSMHVVENAFAGYIDNAGQLAGFHLDFLTALEENSGLCLNKTLLPYSRARRDIKIGRHDGGILAGSADLNADAIYITKLVTSKTVIIPRKGLSLASYQDLLKIKIGKIRGTGLNEKLDNDSNIAIVYLANYRHGLQLLKKGRIDAIAGNELGLSVTVRLADNNALNLAGKLDVGERNLWLVLSKKSAQLDKIPTLRKYAQQLVNEGVVDNIIEKYFGEDWLLAN